MTIKESNHLFDVYLEDDGTMDTVLSVSPKNHDLWARFGSREIRFDCEYASAFRKKDGSMTQKGFRDLAYEAAESYCDMFEIY